MQVKASRAAFAAPSFSSWFLFFTRNAWDESHLRKTFGTFENYLVVSLPLNLQFTPKAKSMTAWDKNHIYTKSLVSYSLKLYQLQKYKWKWFLNSYSILICKIIISRNVIIDNWPVKCLPARSCSATTMRLIITNYG